jgi:hypothetical protein
VGRDISRELLAKAEALDDRHRVMLDMDSTEIPLYASRRSARTGATSSPLSSAVNCSIAMATA